MNVVGDILFTGIRVLDVEFSDLMEFGDEEAEIIRMVDSTRG